MRASARPTSATSSTWPARSSPEQVSAVAKRGFFRIADLWGLTPAQMQILLGAPSRSTFYGWKKGAGGLLPRDTLERISYLVGIYKALQVLFPDPHQADAWIKKPNETFGGRSALDRMLAGNVADLQAVRSYVDYVRGGPS